MVNGAQCSAYGTDSEGASVVEFHKNLLVRVRDVPFRLDL